MIDKTKKMLNLIPSEVLVSLPSVYKLFGIKYSDKQTANHSTLSNK